MTSATSETTSAFRPINRGYDSVFRVNRLSVGLVVPIENYSQSPVPQMDRHVERVQLAESLGFSSVWLRDVPFNVPSFGDAGQTYDPFVYLGLLAGQTQHIALGVASVILPLRHPAHVAKAAATADVFSGGRMILGVASGDRPDEYPALNIPYAERGARFRESFEYIRRMSDGRPNVRNRFGSPGPDIEMLPKPVSGKLPMLITGGSQQGHDWLTENGDGYRAIRDLDSYRILVPCHRHWISPVAVTEHAATVAKTPPVSAAGASLTTASESYRCQNEGHTDAPKGIGFVS